MRAGRRGILVFVVAFLGVFGPPAVSFAQADYDPRSAAWNGTSELMRIASEAHVEVRPTRALDWDHVQHSDALLVLYPRQALGVADLSAFLDDGGRVAWLDDFGASEQFLEWFQFRREADPHGIPRTPELPELLLARPRSAHVLTENVDVLVTNIPVALSHPRLSPVFDLPPEGKGFLLVGQIGRGKLVVAGDPSVLLNTMMRFPGNRQFARNLVEFLGAGPGTRVHMVWGDATARGVYRTRGRAKTPVREAVNTLNDSLGALSRALGAPPVLRPFAMLLALGVACVMGALTWGRRPSERYGPRGPLGAAAGIAERVTLYTGENVNLLIPALRARRLLEQSLLRAVGMHGPGDARAAIDRASPPLSEAQRAEARNVLAELDALGSAADEDTPPRVTAARFQSLWRRIGAILRPRRTDEDLNGSTERPRSRRLPR